jgi:hypothetical protein
MFLKKKNNMAQLLLSLKYKLQNIMTYLGTLLFPREKSKLAWKIYIYFRWVDDIVDNNNLTVHHRISFLDKQNLLIKKFYLKKTSFHDLCYEEKCIYDVVQYYNQLKQAKEFKEHILDLLWTFEFDVKRIGTAVTLNSFMSYSRKIGKAFAFFFVTIYDISSYKAKYDPIFKKHTGKNMYELASDYAHYAHIIHIIRDFHKDTEKGIINRPSEFKRDMDFIYYLIRYVKPHVDALSKSSFFSGFGDLKIFFAKFILFLYLWRFKYVLDHLPLYISPILKKQRSPS